MASSPISSSATFPPQQATSMAMGTNGNEMVVTSGTAQMGPPVSSTQATSSTPNHIPIPASNQTQSLLQPQNTTSQPSVISNQSQISSNQSSNPPLPSQPPIPPMSMVPQNQPPPSLHPGVVMTPPQLQLLRLQIMAYKCIARSQPLPDNVRMALLDPKRTIGGLLLLHFFLVLKIE